MIIRKQIETSETALKLFRAINRKAVAIAKNNGATGTGENMIRLSVSIAYGIDETNIYARKFHLKFNTLKAIAEFESEFAAAADQVNMFDRGVTFHIEAA